MASSVRRTQRWLAWLLAEAQRSDGNRDSLEIPLREFALAMRPQLEVDWDAEAKRAPETRTIWFDFSCLPGDWTWRPGDTCALCGGPVTWRNSRKAGYCARHEEQARRDESEATFTDDFMRAQPPLAHSPRMMPKAAATDPNELFVAILQGLRSFLASSEFTFPQVTLMPLVTWGREGSPQRTLTGSLHDIALFAVSELLVQFGDRIKRCQARKCRRAFLPIGRQRFCTARCSSRVRHTRFRRKLGKEDFRERRRTYGKVQSRKAQWKQLSAADKKSGRWTQTRGG